MDETLERLVPGHVAGEPFLDRPGRPVGMDTFKELGVTALLELCPGRPLLTDASAKRARLPGARTLALKTPADLDAHPIELIAEHAA
ncbi:[acyl-carrier-protein] S-malonyltransferase OS=Streptomyces albaduncus OX=68172 GN=FHS32_006737 PE=4 SV=1 [Streptomyces griseoloalbus]